MCTALSHTLGRVTCSGQVGQQVPEPEQNHSGWTRKPKNKFGLSEPGSSVGQSEKALNGGRDTARLRSD